MKIVIAGDIDNWMDLRDKFIEVLEDCDTSIKLDRFLTGILISLGGVDTLKKTREGLGLKQISKSEEVQLRKEIKEEKKKK